MNPASVFSKEYSFSMLIIAGSIGISQGMSQITAAIATIPSHA
jgi:hypothetical protein